MNRITVGENQRYTVKDSVSFNRYLVDVNKASTDFDKETELMLGRKAQIGDESALERLITSNLSFVISVAKQYASDEVLLEDLINEGNIGLINAAKSFDPEKGFKLITYAVWQIRIEIQKAVRDHGRKVYLPVNQVQTVKKFKKVHAQLQQKYEAGIVPFEDIAAAMSIKPERLREILGGHLKEVSLDEKFKEEDPDSGSLIDIVDSHAIPPDNDIVQSSLSMQVEELLLKLSPQERSILAHSFGLDNAVPMDDQDLAYYFKMSVTKMKSIRTGALRKMRPSAQKRGLQVYLET